jgi:hypothetical protein
MRGAKGIVPQRKEVGKRNEAREVTTLRALLKKNARMSGAFFESLQAEAANEPTYGLVGVAPAAGLAAGFCAGAAPAFTG